MAITNWKRKTKIPKVGVRGDGLNEHILRSVKGWEKGGGVLICFGLSESSRRIKILRVTTKRIEQGLKAFKPIEGKEKM